MAALEPPRMSTSNDEVRLIMRNSVVDKARNGKLRQILLGRLTADETGHNKDFCRKEANELSFGARVRVEGTRIEACNGKIGVALEVVPETQRWSVRFDDGLELQFRPECLTVEGHQTDVDPDRRLLEFDIDEASSERAKRTKRKPLRLFLIRHAQSNMNAKPNLICGRTNHAPLTELGEAQAVALGRRLRDAKVQFDKVYSSTAIRAKETARIACTNMGMDPSVVQEVPDVLELCMGEWTEKERAVVYDQSFLKRVAAEKCFLKAPGVSINDAPPGGLAPAGESQWDVECRVAAFIDSLLEAGDVPPTGEPTVAVFMHGLAIKCFLRRICGGSATFAMHCEGENTSIFEFVYKTGSHNLEGWRVVRVNDSAHLEGSDRE